MCNTFCKVDGFQSTTAAVFQGIAVVVARATVTTPIHHNTGLTVGIMDGSDTAGSIERFLCNIIIHRQSYYTQAGAIGYGIMADGTG